MDESSNPLETGADAYEAVTSSQSTGSTQPRFRNLILLASVFVVGGCGLLYELVAGAAASYLMGDTVAQYSLVIGIFLASMGAGAFITQWIHRRLLDYFIMIQLVIAVVGGFSALTLFAAFAYFADITFFVLSITGVCGGLVGMEIPLVLRILRGNQTLRVSVAQVLTLDYFGALVASVSFPFVILPLLGLVKAAFVTGIFNGLVAVFGTCTFWNELSQKRWILVMHGICWLLLVSGWLMSGRATSAIEDRLYPDEIVYAESTRYQRVVITRRPANNDIRLHLEGHLQFSSIDEHRYHESLVEPAMAVVSQPRRILILGGGDGLVARSVLRHPSVERIDLVDIDQRVVELFRTRTMLKRLNESSLLDPRVNVEYDDAFAYLRNCQQSYDVIIADLPDPSNIRLNKLYTRTFYRLALGRLRSGGAFVTQATSPYYARNAYWCIVQTIQAALDSDRSGSRIVPYHVEVPSFGGDWGFVLVAPKMVSLDSLDFQSTNRFLDRQTFATALRFPLDSSRVDSDVNRLLEPVLVRLHKTDWSKWYE